MFGFFRKKAARAEGPDFSDVDSLAKADALFQQGRLEKLFMRPLEFGGEDHPLNTLYVPLGIAALKSRIDNHTIAALLSEGKVTQYQANVEYQGKSVVPIAVTITASEPGSFTATINIWGQASKRESSATRGGPESAG
jgi:hypothetical protein